MAPYTVKQIVDLFKLLSRLGGPYGIIRQSEFFVYTKKDREAVLKCMDLGLKFPEITTWIRASKEDFKLVKDLDYDVVFWAQAPECSAFTFDWPAAKMTVSYNGAANDDYRDAFYAVRQDLKVTDGALQETVTLYRPFAQINFGAADYQSVVDYYDETSVDAGMQSALVSAEVPNTLDLLTEALGTETAAADFRLSAIPNDPRLLEVNGVEYKYVSMNYVLAPKGTAPAMLSSITASFQYTAGNIDRTDEVKNVPYLRNHRTTIIGNFFTETAILNIEIDENFNDPDYNI
jgi:hypothetical protein